MVEVENRCDECGKRRASRVVAVQPYFKGGKSVSTRNLCSSCAKPKAPSGPKEEVRK